MPELTFIEARGLSVSAISHRNEDFRELLKQNVWIKPATSHGAGLAGQMSTSEMEMAKLFAPQQPDDASERDWS